MSEARLPDLRLDAEVRVRDENHLRDLLTRPLDFGCRPQVIRNADGSASVLVIATSEQMTELGQDGFVFVVHEIPPSGSYEVGTGDRFEGGRVIPQGFGRKAPEPPAESSDAR